MTRSIWNRVVARLFDKKSQVREQSRRKRLGLEWLEVRLAPATDIWTGLGGANTAWSNAANWSRANIQQVPQAGDDLLFDGRTTNRTTNNDLAAGFSINLITIDASNYTLGGATPAGLGNRITLGAAGIHVNGGKTNEKVALDLQLGTANIATTFSFTVDSGADLTVSGHISGFANVTLAKKGTGNGILTLTNDNTVVNAALGTGLDSKIDIQTGILAITNSKALGNPGTVVAPGASFTTVEVNAQLQIAASGLSIAEALHLNGVGIATDGAILETVGTSTWTGAIQLDSDSYLGAYAGTVLNISGLVTDLGASSGHNITKVGAGQDIFSRVGGNTYRGQTIVNNGILTIQDPLSLGYGADSTKAQSGTPLSGTIVNSNSANGFAGTLQLQFNSVAVGDPNGILQNPALPYNSVTNIYTGFQVFNDLITLNGNGFNGLGALSNASGNNGWDGNVILGSGAPANSGSGSMGAATGSTLTVSGVVTDGPQLVVGSPTPGSLVKLLPGRVILNNANTYTGTTFVAAGALQIDDSTGLGSAASLAGATVGFNASLELGVDSGFDGTAGRSHGRNLGYDSVNKSVASNVGPVATANPVQELFLTPGSTSTGVPAGSFTLTFQGQTTTAAFPIVYSSTGVPPTALAVPPTALAVQNALNALSTIKALGAGNTGTVTVTAAGGLYRIQFNGSLAVGNNVPLLTVTVAAKPVGGTAATAAITPVYGLTVSKTLNINGNGLTNGVGGLATGGLRSVTGINTYAGNISLGGGVAGVGVDSDSRKGHPLADSTYFVNDYSLNVTGNISGGSGTTFEKDSTGQLILGHANTYFGATNVLAGWITVEDSGALGVNNASLADTIQTNVTVQNGASIHFKSLSPNTGLNIVKSFILSGLGLNSNGVVNTNYSMIAQEGALLNLSGTNTITGNIALNNNVGIGSQNLDPAYLLNPSGPNGNSQSQLTFTGSVADFQAPSRTVTSTVFTPRDFNGFPIQPFNFLQNTNDIDTGFKNGGTITINWDFDPIGDQIQIWSAPLGDPSRSKLYDSGTVTGAQTLPITVAYAPNANSSKIEIIVNPGNNPNGLTGWAYTAIVKPNAPVGLSGGITKLGSQIVSLQGDGTYTGANDVKEGTLLVQNTSGLGLNSSGTSTGTQSYTTTGTTVEAGGRLQIGNAIPINNGGVNGGSQILSENLTLNGQAQQIDVSGVGGTFTLSFNGATTGALAFNVPANGGLVTNLTASIENALNGLSTIGGVGGSVKVSKIGSNFIVVFSSNLETVATANTITATVPTTDSSLYVAITNLANSLGVVSGDNLWKGGLTLGGDTTFDVGQNARLTIGGAIDDATNLTTTGSGITKTGNGELLLQGGGTYRGTNFINGGVLTAANSQALGAPGSNESVQKLTLTGDFNFTLTFNGKTTAIVASNPSYVPSGGTDTVAAAIKTALDALTTVKGPSNTGFVSVIRESSFGGPGNVFDITFSGAFLLGQNLPKIAANVTSVVSGSGVSATTAIAAQGYGGTVVANGAQLQLRGNLNIAGEALTLAGSGPSTPTNIPVQWFTAGSGAVNNGQTAGAQAISGRVSGIATDPTDDNVIYISTAGGGAWKTINGGTTWTQLFDGVSAVQTFTVKGTAGTFTLKYGTATTTAIPFNASAQQVQDALNALGTIQNPNGSNDQNGSVVVGLTTTIVTTIVGGIPVNTPVNTYTITYSGGSLAGTAVANGTLSVGSTAGAPAPVVTVNAPLKNGAGSPFALFTGAIAIAPSNPSIIYLGTGEANNSGDSYYGTGIYKSTDSGRTWSLVVDNTGANPLYGQVVSRIVVDPTNPNLFYAATTDFGVSAPVLTAAAGVWRFDSVQSNPTAGWLDLTAQTSAGRGIGNGVPGNPGPDDDFRLSFPQVNVAWSDLALTGPAGGQQELVASLGNYYGTLSNAVYRCIDPQSATPIWNAGTPGAAANQPKGEFPVGNFTTGIPINGNIKIAATTVKIYSNPNVGLPVPNDVYWYDRTTIYAAVTYPTPGYNGTPGGAFEYLYVGSYANQNVFNGPTLVFAKDDITWTKATAAGLGNYLGSQGWYDSFVAVDPGNPKNVYVGGVVNYQGPAIYGGQIYATTDGGATFTDISIDSTGKGPHTDEHAAVIDAEGRLVVGNDGGIFRSTPSKNFAWTDINGNLNTITFNGVSQSSANPDIVIGASQDNGAEITTDGQTWTHTDDGDGGQIAFNPLNPNIAYHVLNGTLRRSVDGGHNWSTIQNVTSDLYFPFVVDPLNGSRLLYSPTFNGGLGRNQVFESLNVDGAANPTFANIGGNLGSAGFNGFITSIAVSEYQGSLANGTYQFDPGFPLVADQGSSTYDPNTIYVTDGSSIAVSKDHAQSWQVRDIPGFFGNISGLTVDPINRDTVYAVVDDPNGSLNRIYKSTDAGQTWANITGDLPDVPALKVVVDPRTGSLYLGNDNGVWTLPNGDTTGSPIHWLRFGAGLPNAKVTAIELNTTLNLLTIGTYGRGAFQLYIDETTINSGAVHVQTGSSTWSGPVDFTGDTTINVNGSQTLANGLGAATLNILGTISDATPGANYAFTKDGQGTLTLSGINDNTYGGVTTVKAGILLVNKPLALGGTVNGTVVLSGASLELESDLQSEPVALNGDGVQPGLNNHNTGALRNITGFNTYTGPLTLATNATIGVDSGSQLTIGSAVGLAGTGTVAGSNNLIKELTGTLVLGSADNLFTGNTQVNAGALQVQNSTALGTVGTATVLDGAAMQIQNDPANSPLNVATDLILSGTGIFGTGALLNTGGTNTWSGKITLTSLPNFSPSSTPGGSVTVGTVKLNDSLTLSGVIGEAAGEPSGLTKVGAGTVILTNANTYSGSTDIQQGALDIQNSNALGTRNTTASIQRITTLSEQQTGNFLVSFTGPNGTFTQSFAYGANQGAVQTGLNALLINAGYTSVVGPNQLQVSVTRTAVTTTTKNGPGAVGTGYLYTVTFAGTLASTTQELGVTGIQGTVAAESLVGIGGVGALVRSGGELDLQSAGNGPISTPATLEIALNGTGAGRLGNSGALNNLSGATNGTPNVIAGQIDLQSNSTVNAAAGTTVAFTGNGFGFGSTLTKTGAGSLQVDGNFSNQFTLNTVTSNDINIALNGGTLSGIGSVGNVTGGGGIINPGDNSSANHIGNLTFGNGIVNLAGNDGGNLDLSANDQVFIDLGIPGTPGVGNDLLTVNGHVNLNGATLTGALIGGGHVVGDTFTILQTDYGTNPNDIIMGQFAGLSTPILEGGNYATLANINGTEFHVEYFNDHIDLIQANNSTSTVVTSGLNPSVFGQSVTFTATVSYTGTGTPTGNVTFYDGSIGNPLGAGAFSGGVWTISSSTLSVGDHSIFAVYHDPSTAFPDSQSTPITQTVGQDATQTTLSAAPNPSSNGQAVTFTAMVAVLAPGAGTPTGTVIFYDGAQIPANAISGSVTQVGGVWSFTTSTLSVGAHNITAVYSGDTNDAGSTSNIRTQTVNAQQSTSTTVTSSMSPSTVGQSVLFTATVVNTGLGVTTPTGNVDFYDGAAIPANFLSSGTSIGNGKWTFSTSALAVGTHTITAVYSGDANYSTSQGTFSQVVNGVIGVHGTTTGVTTSLSPVVVNQNVTFTATVTPSPAFAATPGGNVAFYDNNGGTFLGNGNSIGGGKWTFTTSFATSGTHVIKATYGGDVNFAISSGTVNESVTAAGATPTTTSIVTSSLNPALVNQAVTLSVKVTITTGGALVSTGTVTFFDGGTAIGTGTYNAGTGFWTLVTSFSTAGAHQITATYSGTSTNATSNDNATPFTQNVTPPGNVVPTIGNVTSSANPSAAGQAVTFSVTITGGAGPTNTGATVTFCDGATVIGTGTYNATSGAWTLTTSSLAAGSHSITAKYSGNATYAAGTSATLTQTVKGITTTSLSSSATSTTPATAVTFTIHVASTSAGNPTGTMTIVSNGTAIGTANYLGNGNWMFTTSFAVAGTYNIQAFYSGDANFGGSASNVVTETIAARGRG